MTLLSSVLAVAAGGVLGGCDRQNPRIGAGDPAPAFRLEGQTEQALSFPGDLQGQVVVVLFWADWCAYCRKELPEICDRLAARADQGLAVLAVNAGQTREVVEAFLQDTPVSCRVLLDTDFRVSDRYGVKLLPAAYVIDRGGVIRRRTLGQASPAVLAELVAGLL